MDALGIEPNTSRMLSERDNQLHHAPDERSSLTADPGWHLVEVQHSQDWDRS